MRKFRIITSVLKEILRTLVSLEAEQGGVLLGYRNDYVVRQFIHDKNATTTSATYELDVAYLNPLMKQAYEEHGYQLIGLWHTHPPGYNKLSSEDKSYIYSQVKRLGLEQFLAPICFSAKDTICEIMPFIMNADGTVDDAELEIVPNDFESSKKEQVIIPQNSVASTEATSSDKLSFRTLISSKIFSVDGYHMIKLAFLWAGLFLTISLFPAIHRFISQLLKP